MATWKQQTLIEAPVQEVWELLTDPARFPEWNSDAIEVTGVPTRIEKGSSFDVTGHSPLGKATTTFKVEEMDDLREIKVRCQTSGFYSHWLLTEARGDTFADVEMGVEPPRLVAQAFRVTHNKRYLRRLAEGALDNLRNVLARTGKSAS
jgi:uncharacterized protein YndB with AHSA1/START domain